MRQSFEEWLSADSVYREVLDRMFVDGQPVIDAAYLADLTTAREQAKTALQDYMREVEVELQCQRQLICWTSCR